MASGYVTPRTRRAPRFARAALGLTGLSILVAACAVSPVEATDTGETALTSVVTPMSGPTPTLLTRSSYDGQITNGNGGCLDLPNGDTTNGNLLHIWACDSNGLNQTWYVDGAGSIHYAADPTKCVDFPAQSLVGNVPTDETQLQIWDCNGASGPDQVWQINVLGNIEFAADTAKCIELRNGSSANNTPVQVFDCNGTSGQTWKLIQGGGVQGFQLQDANGACLAPSTSATTAPLVLEQCNGATASQQWEMDGRGGLFNTVTEAYATLPTLTSTSFVLLTQLVLGGAIQPMALSSSSHTLVAGGLACVEARSGSAANGTIVQGNSCNGTLGQTWFAKPMGGTCAGTVASNGTCNSCGTLGGAPCAGTQVGCDAGLVEANNGTTKVCTNVCGAIGQLPCSNGPMGYQNGQWQGGCTEWDAVILAGSNLCQWPTSCGHKGQGCCDAGSLFQAPNATTDLCHDGSICDYEGGVGGWPGSWQCVQ